MTRRRVLACLRWARDVALCVCLVEAIVLCLLAAAVLDGRL